MCVVDVRMCHIYILLIQPINCCHCHGYQSLLSLFICDVIISQIVDSNADDHIICFPDTLSDSAAGATLQLKDDIVPYYLRPKDPVVGRASTEQLLVAATGRPVTHSDIVAAVGTLGGTPFRIHSRYAQNHPITITVTITNTPSS